MILLAYGYIVIDGWKRALKEAEFTLQRSTELLAQNTRSRLSGYSVGLKTMGRQLVERGALFNPAYGQELIDEFLAVDSGTLGYSLALTSGQVVLMAGMEPSDEMTNLPTEPGSREGLKQALVEGKLIIGRPFFHALENDWIVPVRQPILDEFNDPLAVMSTGFSLTKPKSALSISLPEYVEVAILRSDGYLLYFHPLPDTQDTGNLHVFYGQPLEKAIKDQLTIPDGGAGFASIDLQHRGGVHYVFTQQIPEYDLKVGSLIPRWAVIAQWTDLIGIPTTILLLSMCGGFLVYQMAKRQHLRDLNVLADSFALNQSIMDSSDYAIISTDSRGWITSFNSTAEKMLGFAAKEMIGIQTIDRLFCLEELAERAAQLKHKEDLDLDAGVDALLAYAQAGKHDESEWTFLRKNGSSLVVLASITATRNRNNGVNGFVVMANDITERRAAEEVLEYQATHDSLTGLPNRDKLHHDFYRMVVRNDFKLAALMLLDLDGFKEVNDTLGHHIGDKVLNQIGPRLEESLRRYGGKVYRLGGDEFVLFIPVVHDADAAEGIAREALFSFKKPFPIDGLTLSIGGSIGYSIYHQDGRDSHELLRTADIAMYVAKRQGSGIERYRKAFDPHSTERLQLMGEFKNGVQRGELVLHYQPKYDLREGRIMGYEALVRWKHPTRGLLYPDKFLSSVELTDSIYDMTLAVLEMALRQQKTWEDAGLNYSVAVNLSARNLLEDTCVWHIQKLIEKYDLNPTRLEIELTETALMVDLEGGLKRLKRIADLGVKIALDDFGTGYSSLGQLRKMPVDTIKIDRSFISNMTNNPHDEAIVRATLDIAKAMDVSVVAEGVEDPETLFKLDELGCDFIQGFFIGKPVSADATLELEPSFSGVNQEKPLHLRPVF
jgi:diguanylate cyclase (GGDEF)-like protein/PAS domain S-box-containing protein